MQSVLDIAAERLHRVSEDLMELVKQPKRGAS
jgi:hypothetical protein